MSRHVDVVCLTCPESDDYRHTSCLGLYLNHGDQQALGLLSLAAELAAIGKRGVQAFELPYNHDNLAHLGGWFAKHEGHDLAVRDEYGDVNRGCGKHMPWDAAPRGETAPGSNRGQCRLAAGHDGPCSREEPKPTGGGVLKAP